MHTFIIYRWTLVNHIKKIYRKNVSTYIQGIIFSIPKQKFHWALDNIYK